MKKLAVLLIALSLAGGVAARMGINPPQCDIWPEMCR